MNFRLDYYKYFLCFMMYAFIGWFYEQFLQIVIYQWGYSDRGVFFGPYCVVYGVGAITFIFCLKKLMAYIPRNIGETLVKAFLVFLGCMLIATAIELLASYMLEIVTGSWPWQTYADYSINFQARIALSPSIRFGLGGMLFLYILQPLFERLLAKFEDLKLKKVALGIFIILIIDIALTVILSIV